jgi:hypothetical protein
MGENPQTDLTIAFASPSSPPSYILDTESMLSMALGFNDFGL